MPPLKFFQLLKQVELVKKIEFVAAALDPHDETFVVHISSLTNTDVHHFCELR